MSVGGAFRPLILGTGLVESPMSQICLSPLNCWSALLHSGATWRVPCWNGACTGRELWATWIDQPRRTIKNHGAGEWRGSRMSVGRSLFAATLAGALALAVSPALSQTLRYANQGELKSHAPYTLNDATTSAHLGHVYEGLVARGKDLKIIPALAESWETPEPTRWRFHLRKGVKFHNGDPFTADDVVFSAERVRAKGSNFQAYIATDTKVVKVDDYTVDFVLSSPNPILHALWGTWYIMDKKWAEAN